MPNTNFQTFHQMGQAINEVVRQATGRDAVQNIDMDHVTVAQNSYYEEATVSGSMVSFTDRVGNTPLEKCVVQIEPVQDLHGYSKPWAGGAGKNILPFTVDEIKAVNTAGTWSGNVYTLFGVSYTPLLDNDNNIIGVNVVGTATTGNYSRLDTPFFTPANDTYILSGCPSGGSAARYHLRLGITANDTFVGADGGGGFEFTATGDQYRVRIGVQAGTSVDGIFYPMVRKSTESDTYAPYTNICPITGWTGANIHVSPTTDAQDGTTYSIIFPAEAGTVYGGSDEVIGGNLTSELANIVFDGSNSEGWSLITTYGSVTRFDKSIAGLKPGSDAALLCNYLKRGVIGTANLECCNVHGTYPTLQIQIETSRLSDNTVAGLMEYFSSNPLQVVYELITHQTYQLTPTEVHTLPGQNNIWADTGDIEVKVKLLKELY